MKSEVYELKIKPRYECVVGIIIELIKKHEHNLRRISRNIVKQVRKLIEGIMKIKLVSL